MPKLETRNISNLGNKDSLLKLGQFMSYYKGKFFLKKILQESRLETSSRLFCVYKKLSATSVEK